MMAKRFFKTLTIRTKLIVLLSLSATVALLIAVASSYTYTIMTQKKAVISGLERIAVISSENIAAALAFDDAPSVERILNPIIFDEAILAVFVYDAKGEFFTRLKQPAVNFEGLNRFEKPLMEIQSIMTWRQINVAAPVVLDNASIGHIELVVSTEAIKAQLEDQFFILLAIAVLTLLVIIGLSIKLEKLFSRPIFDLLRTIKEVSEKNDYTLCACTDSKDEFQELFRGFNRMLQEIRSRDELLKQYSGNLEVMVDTKTEELKVKEDHLKKVTQLAETDALTALPNRRHVMELLEVRVEELRNMATPLGVVMCDIDLFKQINDNYGHAAGDTVLKVVSDVLKKGLRKEDIVGRIGGEEFLFVIGDISYEHLFEMMERFRCNVEQMSIVTDSGESIGVTISMGISWGRIMRQTHDLLLKYADNALYTAKRNGRNRIEMMKLEE